MDREPIVAIAFLTDSNLRAIGQNLERVYPLDESAVFGDLLRALDEAERARAGKPKKAVTRPSAGSHS